MKTRSNNFLIQCITQPITQRITLCLGTILMTWAIGLYVNQQFPTPDSQWLKWLYEQKRSRFRATQDRPRLIILGGSGTFFGIDSELLEQQLARPVVNAGVHAGLGLNATLNLFMQEVKAGDQVVVIPEYGMLGSQNGVGELSALLGSAIGHPTLGARTPTQVIEEGFAAGRPGLKSIAYTLNQVGGMTQDKKGYAQLMNRYGDAQEIPQGQFKEAPAWRADRKQSSVHSIQQLHQFRQQLAARGAQLTIALPWLLAKPEPETDAMLRSHLQVLQEIAPVVTNPETLNAQSDVSLFSDTAYHLSVKGRKLRSQELADQLKHRFQQNP
jgi:hypothetical protein